MATTSVAPSEETGDTPVRAPLQPRALSPKPGTIKQIRRKDSFVRRVDSSEEFPSPHESIYEAFYFSATNSDSSSNRIELVDIPLRKNVSQMNIPKGDENSRAPSTPPKSTAVDDVQFLYGHGTTLETITEQKSNTTMRTITRPKSADDLPSVPFLRHRDSFKLAKSPRRKVSFSVDDVASMQKSYHEACAAIERKASHPLFINEVYAEPKVPIKAPPDRPPTPPGMPSWTEAQRMPSRPRVLVNQSPATQNRLQRLFNIPASGTSSRDRAVSAPIQGRAAPRFRPPKSVYGPIDQHPFVRAVNRTTNTSGSATNVTTQSMLPRPKGKRKLQRVRFTPSATARDSELNNLQTAMETTRDSAIHPTGPMQPVPLMSDEQLVPHCPHRKGRLAALKKPNKNASQENMPQSNERYLNISSYSPSRTGSTSSRPVSPINSISHTGSIASSVRGFVTAAVSGAVDPEPRRTASVSSSAHLMAGALRSPSHEQNSRRSSRATYRSAKKEDGVRCWKCKLKKGMETVDRWWLKSASCLCFVCCGIDMDDDLSASHPTVGHTYSFHVRGSAPEAEMLGPRRVILERTPAGGL